MRVIEYTCIYIYVYVYVYIYEFRHKPPYHRMLDLSQNYFVSRISNTLLHLQRFSLYEVFRKVPEGFRKTFRKPSEAINPPFSFTSSSGRFRKATGRLSGSLWLGCSFPRSSGRFRKVSGSATGSLSVFYFAMNVF